MFYSAKILPHFGSARGLNFVAINLKLVQIVGHIVVYNLLKFQVDSIKIEASQIQNAEEFSQGNTNQCWPKNFEILI